MSLPRIIEYLLSIRRPGGGGSLVAQGQSQTIIPIMPPGATITLQAYPFASDYMDIMFQFSFDPAMVPNAFYAWGSYFGARPWEGIAHSWWMSNNISSFVFITESEPAYALIFNRSPVAQYYAGTSAHIAIASEDDYFTMYEEIERMATSFSQNALAKEANILLRQLVTLGGGSVGPSEKIE
ncbi:hypothetical protein LCGC14_0981260 [marine sediment metagenome]|uniref:Uncharacterized protein n=1 Tax=marine sediment metagenome TaxID=412755 RepID=A0A0F9RFA0_9ZZZZ